MGHFNNFPQEVVCTVLENLDLGSLSSTAIVSSPLRYPSERLMYHNANFWDDKKQVLSSQRTFLRTTSLSERRARHVNTLVLHELGRYDLGDAETLRLLEKAMKLMVNLKNLCILGTPYIDHAHLESATFSLTTLVLYFTRPDLDRSCNEYERFLAILKAHPDLRGIALPDSHPWTTPDDHMLVALEEEDHHHHSAIICPRLEHIQSIAGGAIRSLFVGRRIKHLDMEKKTDGIEEWGSQSFSRYSHLRTLHIRVHSYDPPENILPMAVAPHLISLTRLHVTIFYISWGPRPSVTFTPDLFMLSIAQNQTLESLTLSADGSWCTCQSEQEDMIQFLYKSCSKLRETFVQRSLGNPTHYHYGVNGAKIGLVEHEVACRPDKMFGTILSNS